MIVDLSVGIGVVNNPVPPLVPCHQVVGNDGEDGKLCLRRRGGSRAARSRGVKGNGTIPGKSYAKGLRNTPAYRVPGVFEDDFWERSFPEVRVLHVLFGSPGSARFWLASDPIAAPSPERPFQPLDRLEDLILDEAGVAQHQAARPGRRTCVGGGEGQGLDAGPQRCFRRPPFVVQGSPSEPSQQPGRGRFCLEQAAHARADGRG